MEKITIKLYRTFHLTDFYRKMKITNSNGELDVLKVFENKEITIDKEDPEITLETSFHSASLQVNQLKPGFKYAIKPVSPAKFSTMLRTFVVLLMLSIWLVRETPLVQIFLTQLGHFATQVLVS